MADLDNQSDIADVDLLAAVSSIFDEADGVEKEILDADKGGDSSDDDDDDIEYEEDEHVEEKQHLKKIQMHEVIKAEDSRMPDVMSQFTFTSLSIARTNMIIKGGAPCIPVDNTMNPVLISEQEIISGKVNMSTIIVDSDGRHHEWRVKDFAYLPASQKNIDHDLGDTIN